MLNGRPVLIVEAEFLIALDIQRMLEMLGVGHTLFARNADEARQLQAHWPDLALAIVEQHSADANAGQLPSELSQASIPVVLTTGDVNLRGRLTGSAPPVVVKPIPEDSLASAVRQALALPR